MPFPNPQSCEPNSTTLIIRRLVDGDDDSLAEYLVQHKKKLVRSANRMLRNRRIDEADLDGVGAVDLAVAELCRLRSRGTLDRIALADDFAKLMATILRRVVGDQKKRSDATRRGGSHSVGVGNVGSITRADVDLDALPSPLPRAEDIVLTQDERRTLLDRVRDPILKAIVDMRCDRYTTKQIARALGKTERGIQRKIVLIRNLVFGAKDE